MCFFGVLGVLVNHYKFPNDFVEQLVFPAQPTYSFDLTLFAGLSEATQL